MPCVKSCPGCQVSRDRQLIESLRVEDLETIREALTTAYNVKAAPGNMHYRTLLLRLT